MPNEPVPTEKLREIAWRAMGIARAALTKIGKLRPIVGIVDPESDKPLQFAVPIPWDAMRNSEAAAQCYAGLMRAAQGLGAMCVVMAGIRDKTLQVAVQTPWRAVLLAQRVVDKTCAPGMVLDGDPWEQPDGWLDGPLGEVVIFPEREAEDAARMAQEETAAEPKPKWVN